MLQELKVCVYDAGNGNRVGSVVEDRVYDLNLCCVQQLAMEKQSLDAYRVANKMVPSIFGSFISGRSKVLSAARGALEWVLKEGAEQSPEGENLFHSSQAVVLRAPILPTSKVICGRLMYKSHADMGGKVPHLCPNWFTKITQVVVGPDDWVVLPKYHPKPVVGGTELTVVIGKQGKCIPEDEAEDHVWGYTILNDLTLKPIPDRPAPENRAAALAQSSKEFDTSAPVGPWIVPKDQIANTHTLKLSLRLNGKPVMEGNTKNMLFSIPAIVAEFSKWFTLNPGDIIATGDIGSAEQLKPGDLMEAEIEGIGVLSNPVRLEE